MLEKVNWFLLNGLIRLVLLMWKRMVLFMRKNHLLRCCGCRSLLNLIGALTLSLLLKLSPGKLELYFVLRSSFLLRLLCYLYKSIIRPCMEQGYFRSVSTAIYRFWTHLIWAPILGKPREKFVKVSRYFLVKLIFFSIPKKCTTLTWKVRHINRSFDSFDSQANSSIKHQNNIIFLK